ncbi:MAG: phosphorylated adapter RNA export RNA-binding domain-containing protein [Anaerolineae bacterium]
MASDTPINDANRPSTELPPPLLAREIAVRLNEPNRGLILAMVHGLGTEGALELMQEVERIEAEGGLATADGARRRTPGGTFIYLAKARMRGREPVAKPRPVPPPAPVVDPFTWEDRQAYLATLQEEIGVAGSAKLTVTGRPGRIVQRADVVMALMRNEKAPALPKGLPVPPTPTDYVVYMTAKQWGKVSAAIADPTDILIIEGYPAFDERLKALSVFALNVTTRATQAAKRPKPPESSAAPTA